MCLWSIISTTCTWKRGDNYNFSKVTSSSQFCSCLHYPSSLPTLRYSFCSMSPSYTCTCIDYFFLCFNLVMCFKLRKKDITYHNRPWCHTLPKSENILNCLWYYQIPRLDLSYHISQECAQTSIFFQVL